VIVRAPGEVCRRLGRDTGPTVQTCLLSLEPILVFYVVGVKKRVETLQKKAFSLCVMQE